MTKIKEIEKLLKMKEYNERKNQEYKEKAQIKIECPYCFSISNIWSIGTHLNTKRCQEIKNIILKKEPEKEDQFKLKLNELKKKVKYKKEYE